MSYIICAKFTANTDVNGSTDSLFDNTEVRLLSVGGSHYTVDIPGDFLEMEKHTKYLCNALIENGIFSFGISHSF